MFTLNYAAYDNLKSVGLQIITNDSIRKSISNLYESGYNFLGKIERRDYTTTWEYFRPRYIEYFQDFAYNERLRIKNRFYVPKDFEQIKNDPDFIRLVKYLQSEKDFLIRNIFYRTREIEQMKNAVESELKKLRM